MVTRPGRSSRLEPRHGPSMRRQWVSFVAGWLVLVAVIGGLAAWEAVRVAEARATVGGGWGAGIAAGTAVSLALAGLFTVTVLVQRRRQRRWRGAWPLLILAITNALLLLVAVLTSTPPRPIGPNPVPYVVTSGVGVAEIAYVSACLVELAVLAAVLLAVSLVRRRGQAQSNRPATEGS
jgi:hypothetical protein